MEIAAEMYAISDTASNALAETILDGKAIWLENGVVPIVTNKPAA